MIRKIAATVMRVSGVMGFGLLIVSCERTDEETSPVATVSSPDEEMAVYARGIAMVLERRRIRS